LVGAQQPAPDRLLKSAVEGQRHRDFRTAIRQGRQVLALRPNAVEARVNLGAALVHVGQFDAAITEYKSALAAAPQKNAVPPESGSGVWQEGRLQERRAINPDDFTASLYPGAILDKRRALDDGKTYLQRTLQLDPASTMAGYEVGMLESSAGQYKPRLSNWKRSSKRIPAGWSRTWNWHL
jgi:tetratricopeptide (TPR) repeat protein